MGISNVELIHSLYTDPASPVCYAGVNALYKEAHEHDSNVSRRDVEEYLRNSRTYTLHKPRRLAFKRLQTVPSGFYTDFQVDLADMQRLARWNGGMRYMLVGIEVLSRHMYAVPAKTKTAKDMKHAFEQLFAKLPALPWKIFSDQGGEFESHEMGRMFRKRTIQKTTARNKTIKAAFAERAIKTIKHRLYRHLTEHKTLRWVDVIESIVDSINKSVNRTTGMAPKDVTFKNAGALWKRLYGNALTREGGKKSAIKRGDAVRIYVERTPFTKGYVPQFSQETFRVKKRKTNRPHTFQVETQDGHTRPGRFYKEELARAAFDDKATVEKAIRRRKNKDTGEWEYLVKWVDQPIETASWLTEKDLELAGQLK